MPTTLQRTLAASVHRVIFHDHATVASALRHFIKQVDKVATSSSYVRFDERYDRETQHALMIMGDRVVGGIAPEELLVPPASMRCSR